MTKGRFRAALAAAGILLALGGVLVLARGAFRDGSSRERSRTGAPPRPQPSTPSKDGTAAKSAPAPTKKGTGTATASAPAKVVAPAIARSPEAPRAPGAEPTREEILAGLARGEPGFELLASRLPEEKTTIAPVWREGDEWLVDTWYRQMQAPNEPWSGPTTWRFRVEGETSFRDRPCLQLTVTRLDDPDAAPTTFYVTRDHRLAGIHATVQQQGKLKPVTWEPSPDEGAKPFEAPFTVVPFDLPPSGAEARVLPPGLSHEAPELPGEVAGAGLPKASELLGRGGAYHEVEYTNPSDGTSVFQRWSPSDPRWPVYSRTHTTLSYRRER